MDSKSFSFFSQQILHPAGDPDGDFHLETSTGALSTSRGLDRETKTEYVLEVMATDRGSPALSATVTVEVKVMDVNDNNPVFSRSSYSVEVSEDAAEGFKVLEVSGKENVDNTMSKHCPNKLDISLCLQK